MGSLSSPIQLVLSSGMKAGFHCETAIYVGRSVSAEAQLDLEPFLRCSSAWTAGEEAKKRHFRESLWPSGINARGNITLRRIRRFWVGGRQPLPWDYFLLARHTATIPRDAVSQLRRSLILRVGDWYLGCGGGFCTPTRSWNGALEKRSRWRVQRLVFIGHCARGAASRG